MIGRVGIVVELVGGIGEWVGWRGKFGRVVEEVWELVVVEF